MSGLKFGNKGTGVFCPQWTGEIELLFVKRAKVLRSDKRCGAKFVA